MSKLDSDPIMEPSLNSNLSLADSAAVTDPPSLSVLSLELQIIVFQSLASLSDVTALARTSQSFNGIWRFNAAGICDAILPRRIECFEDAQTLIEAQAHDEKEDAAEQDKNRVAIRQTQRYLSNQDTVHRTCSRFEHETLRTLTSRIRKGTLVLSPTERIRFIHSYYQLWIHILIVSKDGWLKPPWATKFTASTQELVLKLEMLTWLYRREYAGQASITPNTIGKHWQGDADRMRKHGQELGGTFFANVTMRSKTLPLLYTVMDDFQDFLESKLSTIALGGS